MENEKANYVETYWNGRGKHKELNAKLVKLIPNSGEVHDSKNNPALEKFRRASNCYYDLYNNGLGNRAQEFRRVFGFSGVQLMTTGSRDGDLTQRLVDKTEAKMNEIILAAAREQRVERYRLEAGRVVTIDDKPAFFISITPVNGFKSFMTPFEADEFSHLLVELLNSTVSGGLNG